MIKANPRTGSQHLGVLVLLMALSVGQQTLAEEVPPGTVISADNLDALQDAIFEGHRIGDLLTESFQFWIREHGLKMKLKASDPVKLDPRYLEATEQNAGAVTLNPDGTVSGYRAGIPFPNVAVGDERAALKLVWNHFYANVGNPDNIASDAPVYVMEADKGVIRELGGSNYKINMEGRYTGSAASFGEPGLHRKNLLALNSPYDLAGLGIYQVQFNDGRADDVYVYVRSIRRVRRSGGGRAWMDSQPLMDLLNDDNQGLDAYPLWYEGFELLGERWVLAVVTAPDPNEPHTLADRVEQQSPWWNPVNVEWEPRKVRVIRAVPPKEHPYGHKVLYQDAEFPVFYHSEIYDKQGNFWRIWRQNYHQATSVDGYPHMVLSATQAIDFKFQRATYIDGSRQAFNDPAVRPDDFSPKLLSRFASGQNGLK